MLSGNANRRGGRSAGCTSRPWEEISVRCLVTQAVAGKKSCGVVRIEDHVLQAVPDSFDEPRGLAVGLKPGVNGCVAC